MRWRWPARCCRSVTPAHGIRPRRPAICCRPWTTSGRCRRTCGRSGGGCSSSRAPPTSRRERRESRERVPARDLRRLSRPRRATPRTGVAEVSPRLWSWRRARARERRPRRRVHRRGRRAGRPRLREGYGVASARRRRFESRARSTRVAWPRIARITQPRIARITRIQTGSRIRRVFRTGTRRPSGALWRDRDQRTAGRCRSGDRRAPAGRGVSRARMVGATTPSCSAACGSPSWTSTSTSSCSRRRRDAGRSTRSICGARCRVECHPRSRSARARHPRRPERPDAAAAVPGGREPSIASVKLQELFGLAESPRLGPRRQPVVFELLAPNGRPVQTTRDLRSFWDTTYQEVRKELRGRYPRHPWPEDPWTAPPTARDQTPGSGLGLTARRGQVCKCVYLGARS